MREDAREVKESTEEEPRQEYELRDGTEAYHVGGGIRGDRSLFVSFSFHFLLSSSLGRSFL